MSATTKSYFGNLIETDTDVLGIYDTQPVYHASEMRLDPPHKYIKRRYSNYQKGFILSLSVSIILAMGVAVCTTLVWCGIFNYGYLLPLGVHENVNYHVTCMIMGPIILGGISIIMYQMFDCCGHAFISIFHCVLQSLCAWIIYFGMQRMAQVHNSVMFHSNSTEHHLYSLHSWFGVLILILYALEIIQGIFLMMGLLCRHRQKSNLNVRIHVAFGVIVYLLVICNCLIGISIRTTHKFPVKRERALLIERIQDTMPAPEHYSYNTLTVTLMILSLLFILSTSIAHRHSLNDTEMAKIAGLKRMDIKY